MRCCQSIGGFTFIELLFSVALSVILLGIVFINMGSLMKKIDEIIEVIQYQHQVMVVLRILEQDIAAAGSFGSSRAAVLASGLQGVSGDKQHLRLRFRSSPLLIRSVDTTVQTISMDSDYIFTKNQSIIISNPECVQLNRVDRVYQSHMNEVLMLEHSLNCMIQASAGAYRAHDYFFDAGKQTIMEAVEHSPPQVILDHVQNMMIRYDVRTSMGIIEKSSITLGETAEVVGIKIQLWARHKLWVVYSPVFVSLS